MIKFSALNESDSSDDEDERQEGGVFNGAAGAVSGVVGKGATKEAQEAEVVELYKKAIEVQQRGGNVVVALLTSSIRDRDGVVEGKGGGKVKEEEGKEIKPVLKWGL